MTHSEERKTIPTKEVSMLRYEENWKRKNTIEEIHGNWLRGWEEVTLMLLEPTDLVENWVYRILILPESIQGNRPSVENKVTTEIPKSADPIEYHFERC